MGHAFFSDEHALATSRVTPHAWGAAVDGEAAKTSDFNAMAPNQGIIHSIQYSFDRKFGVALSQLRKSGSQLFHQVGTRHEILYGATLYKNGLALKLKPQHQRLATRIGVGAGAGFE
jgi:hypothetical protein